MLSLSLVGIAAALVPTPPPNVPIAVERVRSLVAGGAARSDSKLASAVKDLVAESTTAPASVNWPRVSGTWRVVNAPHIDTLSSVFFTKFSPIEYVLTGEGGITSYVRYSGLPGDGWLCTDGTIANEPTPAGEFPSVKIMWDRIWWAPSASDTPPAYEEGTLGPLVQALGRAGFVEGLSVFPVRFVGDDVAVFNFQSFTVTAQRQA